MTRTDTELYEFGHFRLDVGERKLERLDRSLKCSLPEKAFLTLVHLVRNSGSLVAKDEFFSVVWPDTIVEENNLGKAIHAIRNLLSEAPGKQVYIETIPKHGYRFIAEVTRIAADRGTRPHGGEPTPRSQSSPAYDLYVRGKVKAGSENIEDTEDAIKVLEAAIAIDPFFAPAYAQLARAFNTRAFKFSTGKQRKVLHENADVAVEKALSIDPDLAEGHFARGLILWTNTKGFPHDEAIRCYKHAIALNPAADEAHHQLSVVYSHIGLLEEAHKELEKALELNPNNTMARFRVGVYLAYQCKFDESWEAFKSIPREVSPMLVDRCKAELLVQMGRLNEAESIVDNSLGSHPEDEGGSFTSVKALLLAKAGKRTDAGELIQRAQKIGRSFGHFHHTAHNIASACAAMGMRDESVNWLKCAADDGFPNYTYFASDPNLEGNREHPPFIEFLSKLQLRWQHFKRLV